VDVVQLIVESADETSANALSSRSSWSQVAAVGTSPEHAASQRQAPTAASREERRNVMVWVASISGPRATS
jgi:hypothetical protein